MTFDSEISEEALLELTNIKNLEYLDFMHLKNVTDRVIFNITNNCKNLKSLRIIEPKLQLSNFALKSLGNLKNIEFLHLDIWKGIEDSVTLSVSNDCKKLKYLYAKFSRAEYTIATISKLSNLKNLEYLDIRNLEIDNNVLCGIASNCRKLTRLYVTGRQCYDLDRGVIAIIKSCPNLETFSACCRVSLKVLRFANEATKRRTNNIILCLQIFSESGDKKIRRFTHNSPFLKLSVM